MSTTVKDILTAIPSRFDADAAGDWETSIQFEFSHEGADDEAWAIEIKGGACTVSEGKLEAPAATVKTPAEIWIGMSAGEVNPMEAFMSGQLKVSGDMGAVMKLNDPSIFKRA